MNNPLVLLALINSIENMDYTNKQYVLDSTCTKKIHIIRSLRIIIYIKKKIIDLLINLEIEEQIILNL